MDKNTSSFTVVGRQNVRRQDWDSFVEACDEAWLWHTFDLLDALSTWWGKLDLSFALVDEEGRIASVVPLHVTERHKSIMKWSYIDSLGGPACRNDLTGKQKEKGYILIRERIDALAKQYRAIDVRLSLSALAPAFRGESGPRVSPMLEIGYENRPSQTWLLDLRRGETFLWENMEKRARNAVRKAEKRGAKVRVADRLEDVEHYYRLHCETYRRTGARPHPKSYFEAIWRDFLSRGLARVLFAEVDGETVAAANFGLYKKAAVYWSGAANAVGLDCQANSLLQWHGIQFMLGQAMDWYETGTAFPHTADIKLKNLSDFKRSFGGELYPIHCSRQDTKTRWQSVIAALYGLWGKR